MFFGAIIYDPKTDEIIDVVSTTAYGIVNNTLTDEEVLARIPFMSEYKILGIEYNLSISTVKSLYVLSNGNLIKKPEIVIIPSKNIINADGVDEVSLSVISDQYVQIVIVDICGVEIEITMSKIDEEWKGETSFSTHDIGSHEVHIASPACNSQKKNIVGVGVL